VIDIGEEIQEGHLKFFSEDFELEVLVDWDKTFFPLNLISYYD
jgi:hypothetical protein